jgi:hypothetical protein
MANEYESWIAKLQKRLLTRELIHASTSPNAVYISLSFTLYYRGVLIFISASAFRTISGLIA